MALQTRCGYTIRLLTVKGRIFRDQALKYNSLYGNRLFVSVSRGKVSVANIRKMTKILFMITSSSGKYNEIISNLFLPKCDLLTKLMLFKKYGSETFTILLSLSGNEEKMLEQINIYFI